MTGTAGARLAAALADPALRAHDPSRLALLARALDGADPPVHASRHGGLVAHDPERGRRLLELDRGGRLVAFWSWRADGTLAWAKCRAAGGTWIGVEPGAGRHATWGDSDRVWHLADDMPWRPLEALTVFRALDWPRLDAIPPLAEPRRLPAGAGTAVLNLVAALMKDQGAARVRYQGPFPTEQLFTALLECFVHDPAVSDAAARFLAGEALDWTPAPHERHAVAPGVWVQARHGVEKVVLEGVAFYRPHWQSIVRREPRVLREEGERLVCSLWALGRSIEDRLVLDREGEVLERPPPVADPRGPAPMAPVWHHALASLIARESAPPLGGAIAAVLEEVVLEWDAVPGDLIVWSGSRAAVSRRLADAGMRWVAEAPAGDERLGRAVLFAIEVARLLAPEVRGRAQDRLAALPEADQAAVWAGATDEPLTPLAESVARLLAQITTGRL
jgi:hypothetical protein